MRDGLSHISIRIIYHESVTINEKKNIALKYKKIKLFFMLEYFNN